MAVTNHVHGSSTSTQLVHENIISWHSLTTYTEVLPPHTLESP